MVTAANENAADTTWFDVVGRAVQENSARRSGWYGTSRTFNADGTLRSWTAASNGKWAGPEGVNYTYDAYGVLQTFTTWGANPNTLAYNAAGQLTSLTYPNGMYRTESPTPQYASMQSSYSYTSVDSALGQTVGLDSVGRISQAKVTGSDHLRVFDYNAAGSLQGMHFLNGAQRTACVAGPGGPVFGAQCPYSYSQQYRADAFYRDGADNVSPNSATAFSYTGNRLTSANGTTYTYDDDGNLTHRVRTGLDQTLYWDSLGRLYSVVTNGTTTNFGYDAEGRRVWKVNPATGDTIRYLYQGDQLYMQLDNNGVPTINYRYAPGEDIPHEIATAGGYFYVARDKVSGSVTGLVREGALGAAAIVARYGYDAFGNLLPDESFDQIGNNVRHAGRLFDPETGLYYNRARYYDPEVGRFISEDPIGLSGGPNQYVYAGNDPINHTDPSGLDECVKFSDGKVLCPSIEVVAQGTPPANNPWSLWLANEGDMFNFKFYRALPSSSIPVVGRQEKPAPPSYRVSRMLHRVTDQAKLALMLGELRLTSSVSRALYKIGLVITIGSGAFPKDVTDLTPSGELFPDPNPPVVEPAVPEGGVIDTPTTVNPMQIWMPRLPIRWLVPLAP
jgi:RHS repeat-associated protein